KPSRTFAAGEMALARRRRAQATECKSAPSIANVQSSSNADRGPRGTSFAVFSEGFQPYEQRRAGHDRRNSQASGLRKSHQEPLVRHAPVPTVSTSIRLDGRGAREDRAGVLLSPRTTPKAPRAIGRLDVNVGRLPPLAVALL